MKLPNTLFTTIALCLTGVPTLASLNSPESAQKQQQQQQHDERTLQVADPSSGGTGNGPVCDRLVSAVIPGNITLSGCSDCTGSFLPPTLSASCTAQRQFCFIPFVACGFPFISFEFNLFNIFRRMNPFTGSVCYNDFTVIGVPVEEVLPIPFCFNFGESLGSILTGGLQGVLSPDSSATEDDPCDASIGDTACTSCTVCTNGKVNFDCTNIMPELISEECSTVAYPPPE